MGFWFSLGLQVLIFAAEAVAAAKAGKILCRRTPEGGFWLFVGLGLGLGAYKGEDKRSELRFHEGLSLLELLLLLLPGRPSHIGEGLGCCKAGSRGFMHLEWSVECRDYLLRQAVAACPTSVASVPTAECIPYAGRQKTPTQT